MTQHLPVECSLLKYLLSLAILLLPSLVARAAVTAQATINVKVIALTGDPAPDGNGAFSGFIPTVSSNPPALNDAGQAAFLGFITGGSGGNPGIFHGNGTSRLVQIARVGDVAPDGNGSFSRFVDPALNDAGEVVFLSFLTGASSDNRGIFRGDGDSSPVRIARAGDGAPDGDGSFFTFERPITLNNAGQVAFYAVLNGPGGRINDNQGIFRGDGTSSPVKIARAGDAAPDGNGNFSGFGVPVLNDAGQVVFLSSLTGASGSSSDNQGIFLGDGTSNPVQIARSGDLAPDGNGIFSNFSFLALNDVGQVAFLGVLTGANGGFDDDQGIFRGDGTSNPVQIARLGDAAPDGNGNFSSFGRLALNAAGQAAFVGVLTGASGGKNNERGLYFYDDLLGLTRVARAGDTLLGSTIVSLDFAESTAANGDERSGLNDLGQIAFRFALADGRSGIAIASVVPEPSALLLGMFAGSAMLRRRR